MILRLQEDWHKTFDLHTEQGKGDPFAAAVRWSRMPMVFADPRQPDMPVVYANNAFCQLTGYELSEVSGRNCRFLQGPETDINAVRAISEALHEHRSVAVDILNYKKDGSTFWNALFISPVFNEADELLYFFSSQFDATERRKHARFLEDRKAALEDEVEKSTHDLRVAMSDLKRALHEKTVLLHEIDHRVKNNLQTISALVAMQRRNVADVDAQADLMALQERIDAIGAVHRRLNQNGTIGKFDLDVMLGDLVPEVVKACAGDEVDLVMKLDSVRLDNYKAAPLGLIVNELLTNALRHAWPAGTYGKLEVVLRRNGTGANLIISDDGKGTDANALNTGRAICGLKLTDALVRQIDGHLAWPPTARGTTVDIRIPVSE